MLNIKNIIGNYMYIGFKLYKITNSTINDECCISFINDENGLYIRHKNGSLIEEERIQDNLFEYDSSFVVTEEDGRFLFECSNKNLKNYMISEKDANFVICRRNTKGYNQKFAIYGEITKNIILNDILSNKIDLIGAQLDRLFSLFNIFNQITNIPKAFGPLRRFQEDGIELLEIFDKICRSNGLKYWIDYGTLLGAVRHGGYIPWDDDLDVCMLGDDFKKFEEIVDNEVKDTYFTYSHNFHPYIYKLKSSKRTSKNAWLDIFPFYYLSDDIEEKKYKTIFSDARKKRIEIVNDNNIEEIRKFAYEFNEKYQSPVPTKRIFRGFQAADHPLCDVREYNSIFPLVELNFENHLFFAPQKYEIILKKRYGNYWNYPAKMTPHLKW